MNPLSPLAALRRIRAQARCREFEAAELLRNIEQIAARALRDNQPSKPRQVRAAPAGALLSGDTHDTESRT